MLIRSRPANDGPGKKSRKQQKHYFAPLLSEDDMDIICGTARSSRRLSNAEYPVPETKSKNAPEIDFPLSVFYNAPENSRKETQ